MAMLVPGSWFQGRGLNSTPGGNFGSWLLVPGEGLNSTLPRTPRSQDCQKSSVAISVPKKRGVSSRNPEPRTKNQDCHKTFLGILVLGSWFQGRG